MALIYKAPKEKTENASFDNKMEVVNQEPSSPSSSDHDNKENSFFHEAADGIRPSVGLSIKPKRVRFFDKTEDEEALVVLRRHPLVKIPPLILFLAMFLVASLTVSFGWLDSLSSGLRTMTVYGWLVLAFLIGWSAFLNWYFNVSIISNKRIINVDFHDLIYREVSDANLDKIQDVTHNMGGLLGIIFNFGNVYVQTAGSKPQIEFLKVPRPAEVASTLRKLREVAVSKANNK